jgi:predicted component of type VI protein secretion system
MMSLAAVVAIYLSLPNRGDPDAPADPEQLELPASVLKDTLARLRDHAREYRTDVAARLERKLELFDPEQIESGEQRLSDLLP